MTRQKHTLPQNKGLNIQEATLLGYLIHQQNQQQPKDQEGYFPLAIKQIKTALSYPSKQIHKALQTLIQHDYIGMKFQTRTQRYSFKIYSAKINRK